MFTQNDFLHLLLLMLSKIIAFKRLQQRHQTDWLSHRARVIELGVLWIPLPVESFAPCSIPTLGKSLYTPLFTLLIITKKVTSRRRRRICKKRLKR